MQKLQFRVGGSLDGCYFPKKINTIGENFKIKSTIKPKGFNNGLQG